MATEKELNDQLNGEAENEQEEQGVDEAEGDAGEPAEDAEAVSGDGESGVDDTEAASGNENEEETPGERQPEVPQSRYNRRVQQLVERTKRAEAEAKVAAEAQRRNEEEMARLRADMQAQNNVRRQQEEELMDPSERRLRNVEEMTRQAVFNSFDAGDKASFVARAAAGTMREKYLQRVEDEIVKARRAGNMNATREGVYVYLRGLDADAQDAKATQVRQKAAAAVKAQRGKGESPRSSAQPSRGKTLEEKLRDVPI